MRELMAAALTFQADPSLLYSQVEFALSEHTPLELATQYLCAIPEGRACEGLCVRWEKL